MTKQVELYFSDLNEKGQRKILEALSYSDPKDGNYDMDICPIAILEFEMEDGDERL